MAMQNDADVFSQTGESQYGNLAEPPCLLRAADGLPSRIVLFEA